MAGTPAKKAVPSLASLTSNTEEEHTHVEETETADHEHEPVLSEHVVATVPNKTPDELSAESADETADRYNIKNEISDEVHDNPNIQAYKTDHVKQIPAGTHLHPDIAKSMQNRGISENTTDSAQVRRVVTDTHDFAPDAAHNDKFDDSELRKNDDDSDDDE